MYKIIAIDADGTLLNRDSLIPAGNKEALNRAQREGLHVVLSSGRSVVTLSRFADELELDPSNSHIISFNGGAVFNGHKEQIREMRMESRLTEYILKHVLPMDLMTVVYYETDKMFVKLSSRGMVEYTEYYSKSLVDTVFTDDLAKSVTRDVYKVLLVGETARLRDVEIFMREKALDMEYGMFFSSPRLIEFTSPLSTKAIGLDFICRGLGIDMSRESIAIGDSFNDLSMIQSAALGVCMANGEEIVKLAADYITIRGNDECGVAEVLEKFVFNA